MRAAPVLIAVPALTAIGTAQSIDVRVPHPPSLAATTGGRALVYEIHLRTSDSSNLPAMSRIEVTDASSGANLFVLTGDSLRTAYAREGQVLDRSLVTSKDRAVVYMWVPLPNAFLPRSLRQRLVFTDQEAGTVLPTLIQVDTNVLVVETPFAAGEWLAGNVPSNGGAHRRFLFPVREGQMLSQRFAIDFTRIETDGTHFRGDSTVNENYHGYGARVVAVADGRVVAVKDSLPENVPGSGKFAVQIGKETVAGNYVMLELGHNRFAMYNHLRPGSIKVRMGESVRRGQVLGEVGNSGRSSGPHLHFQVMNASSGLEAEGVAYVFARFRVVAKCDDVTCTRTTPRIYERRLPREGELLSF